MNRSVIHMYAVVLAADNQYLDKVDVLIKSICANNQYIKFYLLHEDIPKEWFIYIESVLTQVNCSIVNMNMVDKDCHYQSQHAHISQATYFRYLIGDLVEEEKVLYLDTDIVVTGDITHLFDIDLGHYYIGAVNEPHHVNQFNAGVMLINNALWKEENISEKLIRLTEEFIHTVNNGDQSILNMAFKDNWLSLPRRYNTMIGFDKVLEIENKQDFIETIHPLPIIVHYITAEKPWGQFSSIRLRETWWFYYALTWTDIIGKWKIFNYNTEMFLHYGNKKLFILTNTQNIAHIEELVIALPNSQFCIAAPTYFSSKVVALSKYRNVFLYPNILSLTRDRLLEECDIYLDINYLGEVDNVVEKAKEKHKIIFAFDETKHRDDAIYDKIIPIQNVQDMIEAIKRV
ncbi:glycosyltransferase family 8 protein [Granulicatella sp. zg-ZJ]|nr:glycosyltransferase family 8 protein [Granulicatella sp. zg-ZJ]